MIVILPKNLLKVFLFSNTYSLITVRLVHVGPCIWLVNSLSGTCSRNFMKFSIFEILTITKYLLDSWSWFYWKCQLNIILKKILIFINEILKWHMRENFFARMISVYLNANFHHLKERSDYEILFTWYLIFVKPRFMKIVPFSIGLLTHLIRC